MPQSLLAMQTLFVAALGAVAASARALPTVRYSAADYVRDYSRSYSKEEAAWRLPLLEERLAAISAHPASSPFRVGVNGFTDRSAAELASMRGAANRGLLYRGSSGKYGRPAPLKGTLNSTANGPACGPAPDVFSFCDWRDAGVVTPPKNQGSCGSCWAFASIETLESHWAIATGGLVEELSEQQILDCVPNPEECGGTGGCGGGTPDLAYEALIAAGGGLASEWTYPYISGGGVSGGECKFKGAGVATITDYAFLPSNDQEAVMEALAFSGPLAVNVDASAWHSYQGGVFTGCSHDDVEIDHVVELVGYGTDADSGLAYWLVRNSWGSAWGENGYIRILREPDNEHCFEDDEPWEGVDCLNVTDPKLTVTACGECGILYSVTYPIVTPLTLKNVAGR